MTEIQPCPVCKKKKYVKECDGLVKQITNAAFYCTACGGHFGRIKWTCRHCNEPMTESDKFYHCENCHALFEKGSGEEI